MTFDKWYEENLVGIRSSRNRRTMLKEAFNYGRSPQAGSEAVSAEFDLLGGDINQGLGNNLEIVMVKGSQDGTGLPEFFVVRAKDTGKTKRYLNPDT